MENNLEKNIFICVCITESLMYSSNTVNQLYFTIEKKGELQEKEERGKTQIHKELKVPYCKG